MRNSVIITILALVLVFLTGVGALVINSGVAGELDTNCETSIQFVMTLSGEMTQAFVTVCGCD